ncbi:MULTISPECIES: hypothetical protein [unclassified Streptomyces]|uniref:hypothetical protein n=1 Tax=unclassified Streptomyces TaxID=2593676 RepID=UPI0033A65EB0
MTAPAEPTTDAEIRAAIDRLSARAIELAHQLAAEQERNFELATAADFADSDAAGYIDRTGLETTK